MAKKPVKSPQSSIDNGELSTSRDYMDFINAESISNNPGKDQWRQRLIQTMLIWSAKPSSLDLVQFNMEYKIPRQTLYDWVARYADVKSAYENMKMFVGCNRRVGSMTKKIDGSYAYRDMHILDKEWLDINKYHADIKKEEDKRDVTFIVNAVKPAVVSRKQMKEKRDEDSGIAPE